MILLIFWIIVGIVGGQPQQPQQLCFRDIEEDICPQREGFDMECDTRCAQNYPMRVGSGCRTRQTGTLLSFFGIRSFVCTCHLSPIACANPQFAIHPFHTMVVQQHSYLSAIQRSRASCNSTNLTYNCHDGVNCGWQYSKEFDWFNGQPNGTPKPMESPEGNFLGGTSHNGATWATISTCDALCSKTSVNLTARIWRPSTVVVELCFKEKETTMCAPVHSTNGHLINEIIPETDYFQISLRFSNVSAGEMVMLDNLSISYSPCKMELLQTSRTTTPLLHHHKPPQQLHINHIESTAPCVSDDCLQTNQQVKMCVGRPGLAYCRQKCKALDSSESSARCIRQRDNPLLKKCICHVRRSPVKKVDGPKSDDEVESNRVLADEIVTTTTTISTTTINNNVECEETLCSFEKDTKCGWADLRMLSRHFNNISVAMKRGDENRYGISRLLPKSYSGLLHKSPTIGPISMSIDVYPSHDIDVRICVQNLRKCQTQTISPRSWNRVSARIRVQSTEKIFILFYNSSNEPKSIAIDNIIIKNGACQQ